MTARGGRWDLVGRGSDPVPTDDCDVRGVARGFERTASEISSVAGRLERLSRLSGWTGKAAETFAEHAEEGARDLQKTYQRYDELGQALHDWESPVRTARSESAGALSDAVRAEEDRIANSHDLLAGIAEPTEAQLDAARRQQERYDDAVRRLRRAKERLDNALDDLDDAARRTAGRIRDAASHFKDGWRDNLKGWVRDHAGLIKKITDILSKVAMVLAAITLVVALTIGAPLWLMVAGLVLAVAILVGHSSLVLADTGLATWGDVAWDLVGVASAGYGVYAAKGLQTAVAASRSQVAGDVYETTRTGVLAREAATVKGKLVDNAMKIQNPANNLKVWAVRQTQLREALAESAAQAARVDVEALARLSPTIGARVLHLDADLAAYTAQVTKLQTLTSNAALQQALSEIRPGIVKAVGASAVGLGVTARDLPEHGPGIVHAADVAVDWVADRAPWRLMTVGR